MNALVKYVVTDPCYILDNKTWDECCKVFDTYSNDEFMYQRFNETVSKALTEFSGFPAYACDTGFGDWTNEIYGCDVIKSDFCADSGMVCVCRLTPEIEKHFNQEYGPSFSGAAIFEGSDDICVKFDQSTPTWTVIKIHDRKTGNFIETMDLSDFEAESEDDYDEEEDY